LAATVVGCRRRCTVVVVLLPVGVAVAAAPLVLLPVGVAVVALILPPMGVVEIVAVVALALPLGVAHLPVVAVAVDLLGVLVRHRLRLRPNRIS
jgi:hypothetical protein